MTGFGLSHLPVSIVILAAGMGGRMNYELPRVLHPLGGAPLLVHAMRASASLGPERVVVVTGHGGEAVAKVAHAENPDVLIAHQAEQKGTAHAVARAREALAGVGGDVVVLYGDTPFVRPETLEAMRDARARNAVVVLGFEAAESALQIRMRTEALDNGVNLIAPETIYFAFDTVIGRDAVVGPGVTLESEATIRAFCHLEGCHVSRGAQIGPFARLRPEAELAEDVHVGNFVEIKNAIFDEGAKVNRLSYIGEGTNIGTGTMLVAHVKIGADAMTGSGSVITRDVPAGALALERSEQVTKPGLALRLMTRLHALKANKQKET